MLTNEEIEMLLPYASPKTCAKLVKMLVKNALDKKVKNPTSE